MQKKIYRNIAVLFAAITLLGLLAYFGGIRPVNIGVFVFPALIAGAAFYMYKKK